MYLSSKTPLAGETKKRERMEGKKRDQVSSRTVLLEQGTSKTVIWPDVSNQRSEKKKNYTSYSKLSEVKLLTIGIASPLRILQWAEKTLPNGHIYGEVLNANTLHHKTLKPQKGGLFCERIFGPVKDFECACGKIKKTVQQFALLPSTTPLPVPSKVATNKVKLRSKSTGELSLLIESPEEGNERNTPKQIRNYCPVCDVEYTWSVIRRYQLGYIKLNSPVTHIWFLKGTPSYLSLLLDMKKRYLQLITYCTETITLENSLSNSQKSIYLDSPSKILASWKAAWASKPLKQQAAVTSTVPNSSAIWDCATKGEAFASTNSASKGEAFGGTNKVCASSRLASAGASEAAISNILTKKKGIAKTHDATMSIANKRTFIGSALATPEGKKIGFSSEELRKVQAVKRLEVKPIPQKEWQNSCESFKTSFEDGKKKKSMLTVKAFKNSFFTDVTAKRDFSTILYACKQSLQAYNTKSPLKNGSSKVRKKLLNKDVLPLFISSLQLSVNYNSLALQLPSSADLLVAEGWTTTKLISKINKISKKLPINYYILCSLERMLNKKYVIYSIIKTWQNIYKQAFLKAIFKVKKIINKQGFITLNNTFLNLTKRKNYGSFFGYMNRASFAPLYLKKRTALLQSIGSDFKDKSLNALAQAELVPPPVQTQPKQTGVCSLLPRLLAQANGEGGSISKCAPAEASLLLICSVGDYVRILRKKTRNARHPCAPLLMDSVAFLDNHLGKARLPRKQGTAGLVRGAVRRGFPSSLHNFKGYRVLLQIAAKKQSNLRIFEKSKKNLKNNILITLKKIKQPILLIKNTTQINCSSFDILKNMQQYFNLNTEYLINLLSDSFLRPLLIILFKATPLLYSSEGNKSNFFFTFTKGLRNLDFLKNRKAKLFNFESSLRKDSWVGRYTNTRGNKLAEVTTTKGSYLASDLCQKNKRNTLKNLLFSAQFLHRALKYNKRMRAIHASSTIPVEKRLAGHLACKGDFIVDQCANSQKITDKKGFHDFPIGRSPETRMEKKLKNTLTFACKNNKDYSNSRSITQKVIYNNVYSLSHRERWESEKDWQVFLLYNSVCYRSEYNDIPIFAYKSHILSLLAADQHLNVHSLTSPSQKATNKAPEKSKELESKQLKSKQLSGRTELRNTTSLQQSAMLESGNSSAFFSGPGIIQQLLKELTFPELKKLDKQNRLLLYQFNQNIFKIKKQVKIFVYDKSAQKELKELFKKRDLLIRRTKLVRKLFRKDSDPSTMILTILPVLPPDLRPIVKIGSQIAASDLNRLYQQVIFRNERLKFFLKDSATSHSYEMKYAQRLLQDSVDNLIQNSKSGTNSEKDSRGRALKSLSDVLKGKQGRFRQFLLGKRVDYSGRSVIVVGPKLQLHECGIPLEMALELYLPFLLKRILNKNYAKTVIGAKSLIKNNSPLAHELLREIMQVSPVLLNRAPTLHRLGIQAFVPKLVEGRAILLHPLVCSAFNADFDGDQMAVHVPITVEARAEAWKLMLSRNNILSPATGDPLAIPSQDMVLGCYYLTTYSKSFTKKHTNTVELLRNSSTVEKLCFSNKAVMQNTSPFSEFENRGIMDGALDWRHPKTSNFQNLYFNHLQDVMAAYNKKKLKIHTLIWVKWSDLIENGNDQEEPLEVRITSTGNWQEITSNFHRFYDSHNLLVNQYMATTPGRILFNLIIHNIQ